MSSWRRTVLAAVATSVILSACSTPSASVSADALWFGSDGDGNPAAGTLPFTVALSPSGSTGLVVNAERMRDEGGGDVWVAMASVSAVVAMLGSGRDPSNVELSYSVDGSIDGPSAGGLMTAATYAALIGQQIRPDVSMTGTVLPDGTLGIVGGIPEKVEAAAEAGIFTVLIPKSQAMFMNFSTGETVDVVAFGAGLGVRVIPVVSVWEGYEVLSGSPVTPLGQADPPPVDRGVLDVYREATGRVLEGIPAADSLSLPGDVNPQSAGEFVSSGVEDARVELESGDPVVAFAMAADVAMQVDTWQAVSEIERLITTEGVEVARQALAGAVQEMVSDAEETLGRVGGESWETVETATGVPTALSWVYSAIGLGGLISEELSSGTAAGSYLLSAAQTLAPVRFRLEVFTPVIVDTYRVLPASTPWSRDQRETSWTLIGVLEKGAAVNMEYLSARDDGNLATNFNYRALQRTDEASPVDRSEVAALGRALYEWVVSTALVAEVDTIQASTPTDGGPFTGVRILDLDQFGVELEGATAAEALQVRTLAARDVNSSALRAQSALGAVMASGEGGFASDADRRLGLAVQWSVLVSGAVARAIASPAVDAPAS